MPSRNTIEIVVQGEDRASKVFANVNSSLDTLGKTSLGVIIGGVSAATSAIAGFATKSIMEFAEFEKSMAETFKLLPDLSNEAMGKLEEDVQYLAARYGQLPAMVAEAFASAIGAGVDVSVINQFMDTAAKAAIAGSTDIQTAVDGLTSVVNAYGADVIDAARASDIMFKTVDLGKVSFDELSRYLFNVIPTASSLGLAFEDVGAAISQLTAMGTPTSVATTQIRQLLVELQKPTTEVSKLFEKMAGKSFPDFIKEGGNLSEALNMIYKGAQDSGTELAAVFGSVEALNAFLGLAGPNAAQYADFIDQMGNSAGSTNRAFEVMSKTISFQSDRLKAKLSNLFINVGRQFEPFVAKAVEKIGDIVSVFDDFLSGDMSEGGDFTGFAKVFFDFLKPLKPAFDTLKNIVFSFFTAFEAGIPFIDNVRVHINAFLAEFAPNLLEPVNTFINTIIMIGQEIGKVLEPITKWVSENVKLQDILTVIGIAIASVVLPAIIGLIGAFSGFAAPIAGLILLVAGLRKAWDEDFLGIRTTITEKLLPELQKFVDWFNESGGLVGVFNKATVAAQMLAGLGLGVLLIASETAKKSLQLMAFFITDTLNKASISATLLIASFGLVIAIAGQRITEFVDSAKKWIETNAGLILGISALVLALIQAGVHMKIFNALMVVGRGIVAIGNAVWGAFTGIITSLGVSFTAAGTAATGLGVKMLAALGPIAVVGIAIAGVIAQINEFNRLTEEAAVSAGRGLSEQIQSGDLSRQQIEDEVFRQMQAQFGDLGARLIFGSSIINIQGKIDEIYNTGLNYGKNLIDGIVQGTDDNKQATLDALTAMTDEMKSTTESNLGISSPSTVFMEYGLNVLQGLVNGMMAQIPKIVGTMALVGTTLTASMVIINGILSVGWQLIAKSLDKTIPQIVTRITTITTALMALTTAAAAASAAVSSLSFLSSNNSGLGGLLGNVLGFANGMDYVDRDRIVKVHRGEAILTADENEARMNGGNSTTNNISINLMGSYKNQSEANRDADLLLNALRSKGIELSRA
jgi:TP901 family phage tail tape measure protein